ncbi:pilin [Patescibacteria group bacterium]
MNKIKLIILFGVLTVITLVVVPTETIAAEGDSYKLAQAVCNDPSLLAAQYGVPFPAQNSADLNSLIGCIQTNIPDPTLIDPNKIYTYQIDPQVDTLNYTRGIRDCGMDVACQTNACHAIYSCHYGGRYGTTGAEAVDFNANDPTMEPALYTAIRALIFPSGACHGKAKYIDIHDGHTHLSTMSNSGCDGVNVPGLSVPMTAAEASTSAYLFSRTATIPNPAGCDDIKCVMTNIIRIALGVLGVFGTFMFVWGGFTWILSGGNQEKIRVGKSTLLYATIGIVLVVLSWIFIDFVLNAVSQGTAG